MHNRRDDRSDRGRSRRDHDDRRRRHGDDDRCSDERRGERGSGPDTRFLQLEMSELLYAEAESVTKRALRELLLEEAKVRFRERFGDQITGLAQLAVDELMQDICASLDVESRIRERSHDRENRRERLADILGSAGGAEEDPPAPPEEESGGGSD